MNEQTAKLIEKLAEKLGTTAEHLWGVLVQQAYIDSVTKLTGIIFSFIILCAILALFPKLKRMDFIEEGDFYHYVVLILFAFVLICYASSEASIIIAGFVNPEYWALKQVLSLKG